MEPVSIFALTSGILVVAGAIIKLVRTDSPDDDVSDLVAASHARETAFLHENANAGMQAEQEARANAARKRAERARRGRS